VREVEVLKNPVSTVRLQARLRLSTGRPAQRRGAASDLQQHREKMKRKRGDEFDARQTRRNLPGVRSTGWFRQQYEYLQETNRRNQPRTCGSGREKRAPTAAMPRNDPQEDRSAGENLRSEIVAFKESVRGSLDDLHGVVAALLAAFFAIMREARGG